MAAPKVSEHYLRQAGHEYVAARQGDATSIGYQLNLKWFLPFLQASHTVLDFGCGNGGMLRLLKPIVRRADGLEVNPAARAIAEQAGCATFGSVDALPAHTYDVVISNHVLEHVRDVCVTLERIKLSMKPGGLIVLKLPIDDWRERHQRRWSADDVDHHLQTWTPRLFANVLFESGFNVRDCRVVTSAWHPRLFPLARMGLGPPAFWAFSVLKKRRQLFAVADRPSDS